MWLKPLQLAAALEKPTNVGQLSICPVEHLLHVNLAQIWLVLAVVFMGQIRKLARGVRVHNLSVERELMAEVCQGKNDVKA